MNIPQIREAIKTLQSKVAALEAKPTAAKTPDMFAARAKVSYVKEGQPTRFPDDVRYALELVMNDRELLPLDNTSSLRTWWIEARKLDPSAFSEKPVDQPPSNEAYRSLRNFVVELSGFKVRWCKTNKRCTH